MPIVDIEWLKDYADVPADLTVEQLSQDLVRVGFEEETIHRSSVTGPLVVGRILDFTPEKQKNGKIINWCHIDVGDEYNETAEDGSKKPRGIICGAPNVAADELVVVALPGAVLPGDFKIVPRKTYGHISNGMCCSAREIGLGMEYDGIILLKDQFPPEEFAKLEPGQDAISLLHLDVPSLEINITPDRGYAFSYRGIAREYHCSTGAAFTDPVPALSAKAPKNASDDGEIAVKIEDDNPIHGVAGCDRYYLRSIHGIKPGVQSPNWLRRRVMRAGVRSLSLVVDATNYVMLDLGQPLHAYDLDKIAPPIVVRRAHEGETLVTLDGVKHDLSVEDLVITDSPDGDEGSRVLGLAGVMGGQYAEVTDETTNVLLESAHFDPVSIARTARRQKLPTEASHRFERGIDTQMQAAADEMAVELITKYAGGEASDNPTDIDTTSKPRSISFRTTEVKRLTDLDVDVDRISDILKQIGCTVAGGGDGCFIVTPPTWRPDLNTAPDLVEEVARIVGYDEIPVKIPSAPVKNTGLTPDQRRRRAVANTLAESGLTETLTYPFVGKADYEAFGLDQDAVTTRSVEIVNPLMGDRPWLRTNVLLTLAGALQRNVRRGMENVQIYELGHVFHLDPDAPAVPALPGAVRPSDEQLAALDAGLPDQPLHVAGILTGSAVNPGWYKDERSIDWTDAMASVDRIAARLGTHFDRTALAEDSQLPEGFYGQSWHPGRTAVLSMPDGAVIGLAGELHPEVIARLGIPEHSAAFEINLTEVFGHVSSEPLQAHPISTFPPVKQDLAFVVDKSVTSAALAEAIAQGAGDVLESMTLFDVYEGGDLGADKKSLAYSVVFRSQSKTLKSKDTKAIRAAIEEQAARLGAQLRS